MEPVAMYKRTVESLRRSIEQHQTPSGRASQRAFCEAYGYDRENLQSVLAGKQEMSVALFLRLAASLKGRAAPVVPGGVERWSLRTWLEMFEYPVHQVMYEVNFEDTGIVQKGKKTDFLT